MSELAHFTKQLRGPKLVTKVLASTLIELSQQGYDKLSFERIAEHAQVNKVTVYRRWPTKASLVRAALSHFAEEQPDDFDTGNLRDDLVLYLRGLRNVLDTPVRRTLCAMAMQPGGEVRDMAMEIWREREPVFRVLFERAAERGEVPAGLDVPLLQTLFHGALVLLICFKDEARDTARLTQVVDIVLHGALASSAAARPAQTIPRQSA